LFHPYSACGIFCGGCFTLCSSLLLHLYAVSHPRDLEVETRIFSQPFSIKFSFL
jgi:hypothetical protein